LVLGLRDADAPLRTRVSHRTTLAPVVASGATVATPVMVMTPDTGCNTLPPWMMLPE